MHEIDGVQRACDQMTSQLQQPRNKYAASEVTGAVGNVR